jgi:hypothetical protein
MMLSSSSCVGVVWDERSIKQTSLGIWRNGLAAGYDGVM